MLNDAEEASTFAFISFALVAFVIYEHLLTAVSEVRTLWSQSYNVISFFLLSNRYLSIAYAFSAMSATIVQDCELAHRDHHRVRMLRSALCDIGRVYAICNRNGWFFILILALGLIPTVTNLYYSANLKISLTPDAGCVPLQSSSAAVSSRFAKITRISAIMLDCIVLASTWARLSPLWSRLRFNGHSVPSILLRNGCSYFLTLLLLNIAEIVVFQLTEVYY
ncbi:hypothetical protein BC629DRAFT_188346 [Irpex lacteus]|nr:hypothetical protein BC629DRAFT_188346 [Irpex lacteus]